MCSASAFYFVECRIEQIDGSKVMCLLQEWNRLNSIIGVVFDNTRSNTGPYSGACITFQMCLGKPIF